MTQYINKDALVAEIKRRIDCCYKMCAGNLDFLQKSYPEHYYSIETYKEILSFLDTLEVQEIDLGRESMKKNYPPKGEFYMYPQYDEEDDLIGFTTDYEGEGTFGKYCKIIATGETL